MDHVETLQHLHHRARETNSDAFVVLHDGHVLDCWSFERNDDPVLVMSITKMVVGLALGRLFRDYPTVLNQPVCDVFPEWRQGRKRQITVAMLLNHTSGIQNDPNAGAELETAPDWVQLALCAELDEPPGRCFSYNNKAVLLLAGLVERVTGSSLDAFVDTVLFEPLGITDVDWVRDTRGTPYVPGGLSLRALDLARIGQLLLDEGRHADHQVVDPAWISQITAPGQNLRPDFGLLCGRWLDPGNGDLLGIYHDGWLGQYLLICHRASHLPPSLPDRRGGVERNILRCCP